MTYEYSQFSNLKKELCLFGIGIKSAQLLKDYGFDINIKDSKGYTPLLKLIEIASNPTLTILYNLHSIDVLTRIQTLLNNGADPYKTIVGQGVVKNAFAFNTDPHRWHQY